MPKKYFELTNKLYNRVETTLYWRRDTESGGVHPYDVYKPHIEFSQKIVYQNISLTRAS